MSGGFENAVVGGASKLIRPAIQSPNFVTGVSGWSVNKDGTAEFQNAIIRGLLSASNVTFSNGWLSNGDGTFTNAVGLFFYNGTPAAGNMTESFAQAAGTDKFGNTFLEGHSDYDLITSDIINISQGQTNWYTASAPQPGSTYSLNVAWGQNPSNSSITFLNTNSTSRFSLDSNGNLIFVAGGDSTVWVATGRSTKALVSGIPISLGSFTSIESWNLQPVVTSLYRFRAFLSLAATSNVGVAVIGWQHGTTITVGPCMSRAWFIQPGPAPSAVQFTHANNLPGDASSGTLVNGQTFMYEIEGVIRVTGSGTLALSAAQSGGGTYTVQNGSFAEVIPCG